MLLTVLFKSFFSFNVVDYEQQRHHLLHKYGIDLDDPIGIADGRKTKRLDPKKIELLMGGGDGETGIFTWREKNKRKVSVAATFSDQ